MKINLEARNSINKLMNTKDIITVAIDGRCAAGKTTLASELFKAFDCNVFHVDHFFLPANKRVTNWLDIPGGNIDKERFLKEVLKSIEDLKPFYYKPFNCQTQDFDDSIYLQPKKLNIIEGSYSLLPEFSYIYDLKVFLEIDKVSQQNRIVKRNGVEAYEKFKTVWIPLEEQYFNKYKIKENSDLVITKS